MNRIQFQKGLSLNEFLKSYGTEARCEAALENARWPGGFVCPACESRSYCRVRHGRCLSFQCNRCRKQVILTRGTVFHSTKLPLVTWFQAVYFLSQTKTGISTMELMRRLGVSYRTAWRMRHKLMQAMAERESKRRLGGRVELDDAYLGGERSGGKPGRGSENKVPFVAAVATDRHRRPRYVLLSTVASFLRKDVEVWAREALTSEAHVVTDGLGGFFGVTVSGCRHERIPTGSGRKAVKVPAFHWVNTVLGNLKTTFDGTFHGFKFEKYAPCYLSEFQYRFNRRYDLPALFGRLLFAGARTRPCPEAWLRQAEARH